ncbi:MAG: protoporphyrinogen/coproporphyrinogen oxidase [Caldisphaera sp.]|uniref:protoporphyrinogen/coproporphyrinogen oxidase n=1 Tax=Caldisphaera sp. TaxID=2060322 RepID=UPI003D0D3204
MNNYDEVILGAGWAGLLYADMKLTNYNYKIAIIEKETEDEKGGLLRSETINGFTFDIGGPHLLFSKDTNILTNIVKLLGDNVTKRERNNYVLYNNKLVPYPFENGIYVLDPEARVNFIKGIIERMIFISENKEWRPKNFLEWITGFFGDYMANEYLIPYNKKIWKRSLENMAADWVFTPGRLPFPNLEDMLKAAAGIPNVGYKEQSYFYYPKIGGIQSLYNSLFNKVAKRGVNFLFGEKVDKIIKNNKDNYKINDKINAKRIVSTIPLPELLISLDSEENRRLANEFDYNSVVVVGIAISSNTPNQTTVYVPDPKIIFHRYTWMSSLIPIKEKSNLIAEITVPKGEDVNLNKITNQVIKNLADIGAIKDEKDVLFSKAWFNKYGYPIYTLNHNEIRRKAMEILNNYGIKSVGRWGSWHYWNTDMVYKAVKEVINS